MSTDRRWMAINTWAEAHLTFPALNGWGTTCGLYVRAELNQVEPAGDDMTRCHQCVVRSAGGAR